MNQIKCLQPSEHAGVLLSNPPQYRCYRDGCHKTWVVGTEAPECTMNQIPNIEETHNTRERCRHCEVAAEQGLTHIHNTREVEEIKTAIKDAILATYPEDIFPTPADTSHLKDNNVAYIMREMAGALAFIAEQVIHHQLQKAREEERKMIASELDELMEQLADIEHDRWSKWQKYLHSKVLPSADDGISLIGTEFIDRWNRQIATPYSELSEAEKESDREQVRPYLELIKRKIRYQSELDQDKK